MGVRAKRIFQGFSDVFCLVFYFAGAATILVLGVIVQILTIKAVIHPANYDEQQLEQKKGKKSRKQKKWKKECSHTEPGLECLIIQAGGFTEHLQNQKEKKYGKLFLEEKNEIRSGYLKRFQREEEICLVSYQLRVQFGNPALRERFPHVLELLLLAALLIFVRK